MIFQNLRCHFDIISSYFEHRQNSKQNIVKFSDFKQKVVVTKAQCVTRINFGVIAALYKLRPIE